MTHDNATPEQVQEAMTPLLLDVQTAEDGPSNDAHIQALLDALDYALRLLGVEWPEGGEA